MTAEKTYYVGLAATMHDPAIAILGEDGEVLFAEASERHLQDKRAYNCAPDGLVYVSRLIRQHCEPGSRFVAAASWSDGYLEQLEGATAAMRVVPSLASTEDQEAIFWPTPSPAHLMVSLRNSVSQAGVNLGASVQQPAQLELRRFDHHLTHAALAAESSPFSECAVAVIDGYGEGRSTGFYRFHNQNLESLPGQRDAVEREIRHSVSLGHFYGRLCALCGFDPIQGEEWKVMGLAAFGRQDPEIYSLLSSLYRVEGLNLVSSRSDQELLEVLARLRSLGRAPGSPVACAADLACTGQRVFEELALQLLTNLHQETGCRRLALAGGCALNSSFNGRILHRTAFDELHVPSAPADDGCALGAALCAWREDYREAPKPKGVDSPYLGSVLDPRTLDRLEKFSPFDVAQPAYSELIERVADFLADGSIVGWLRGKAEYGPRALGNRSILADPRRAEMKDRINSGVKFREDYRPFAPAVLDDRGSELFEEYQTARYMERTLRFRKEAATRVPAVVHQDGTGRLQSVRHEWNPALYDLIHAFDQCTGVPVVLNTSFNIMGRPIAHSVEDAVATFLTTGLDVLVLGERLLVKRS